MWVHKAHFVCLLAHLKYLSSVLNDPVLFGKAIIQYLLLKVCCTVYTVGITVGVAQHRGYGGKGPAVRIHVQ